MWLTMWFASGACVCLYVCVYPESQAEDGEGKWSGCVPPFGVFLLILSLFSHFFYPYPMSAHSLQQFFFQVKQLTLLFLISCQFFEQPLKTILISLFYLLYPANLYLYLWTLFARFVITKMVLVSISGEIWFMYIRSCGCKTFSEECTFTEESS